MAKTELSKVKLLKGTFLVEVNKEENTTKSGLVIDSQRAQETATVVASSEEDLEGNKMEVEVNDIVLLNPTNNNRTKLRLDGTQYELASRSDILLIKEKGK